MTETLLWRNADWRRQQHSNRTDEHFYRSSIPPSHRWKRSPECEPKWQDQTESALEAGPSLEERPRQEILNTAIDNIYDELAELVALRTDQPNPNLESQISFLFQRLRELQEQEGNLIQETVKSLAAPIVAGLEILKDAEAIRAKYGSASSANIPPQGTDEAKT